MGEVTPFPEQETSSMSGLLEKYEGDVEWFFDDHFDGKFTKEEFLAGMRAMGFDDAEIAEFVRDGIETARRIVAIIDEKGGADQALRHFGAYARRSQLKLVE